MNFRSSKVDQRYLSPQDRQSLKGSAARQTREQKRVSAKRGALAYQRNKDIRTTDQTPGSGGFSAGIGIQQERTRQQGEEKRRSESLRPGIPSIGNPFPEDPV